MSVKITENRLFDTPQDITLTHT